MSVEFTLLIFYKIKSVNGSHNHLALNGLLGCGKVQPGIDFSFPTCLYLLTFRPRAVTFLVGARRVML